MVVTRLSDAHVTRLCAVLSVCSQFKLKNTIPPPTADLQEACPMNMKMQRVDSGATDDSPFASSLTTPVDEDVMGIEDRVFGMPEHGKQGGGIRESGSAIYLGSEDGDGVEFRKELQKKACMNSLLAQEVLIVDFSASC